MSVVKQSWLAEVQHSSPSVCVFVLLFVRSITQKRMLPKCSNLAQGMTLGYPRNDMVLGLKGQGHMVLKCIFHINVRSITLCME